MSKSLLKTIIISYILYNLAIFAGKSGNAVLLYVGIAVSFWIIMIRFPIFKKPIAEDIDGKEL